jgi:hypothetical protein
MASNQAGRSAASLLIAIWLLIFLPPREAEWRFCAVGKPAGRRFSRAGPRMAHRGDPRSRTGARVPRASARGRTPGARALGYLGLFQVTRCKSETLGDRYRRNGYVLRQQTIGRLSGRLRRQVGSPHRWLLQAVQVAVTEETDMYTIPSQCAFTTQRVLQPTDEPAPTGSPGATAHLHHPAAQ